MSQFPSPESLANSPRADPEHYLLALDRTGLHELPLPHALSGAAPSWRDWPGLGDLTKTPAEMVIDDHASVVIRSFVNAIEFGFAACSVQLRNGHMAMLGFWNRLDRYGCVVVVAVDLADQRRTTGTLPSRVAQHTDEFGVTLWIDDGTRRLLGWGDEVIGASRLDYQHPDDIGRVMRIWAELLADPQYRLCDRGRMRKADGTYVWFDAQATNRLSESGRIEIEMFVVPDHLTGGPPLSVPTETLDDLLSRFPAPALLLDADDFVLGCNDEFRRLTAFSYDDTTRRPQWPLGERGDELRGAVARGRTANSALTTEPALRPGTVSFHTEPLGEPGGILILASRPAWAEGRDLPKGFSAETMDRVVAALLSAPADGLTYAEVADLTNTSKVTARRYVSLLYDSGAAKKEQQYGTPGRPEGRFHLVGGVFDE